MVHQAVQEENDHSSIARHRCRRSFQNLDVGIEEGDILFGQFKAQRYVYFACMGTLSKYR